MSQKLIGFLGKYAYGKYISVSYLQEKRIIVYGAGSGFFTFSSFILDKYKLKPYLVLDSKFGSHETFNKIQACSPFSFDPMESEKDESVVIITIGRKNIYKEIRALLESELGFQNIVWAFDIFEYSLHHTPADYINNIQRQLTQNFQKIKAAYDIFHDDVSKDIFKKIIGTYFLKRKINIPNRPLKEQYFPKDINLKKGYDCFVDCGTYTGEIMEQFKTMALKINTLICFEPDPENFRRLLGSFDINQTKKIIAFPCGLCDAEKILRFKGNEVNSSLSESGDLSIQTVAIDHVLHGFKPTFIKMDIEGAELKALKGARETIIKSEADLAISVYHLVNHIWDIPLYIASLGVDYKIFLRNYTSFVSETVLYATK